MVVGGSCCHVAHVLHVHVAHVHIHVSHVWHVSHVSHVWHVGHVHWHVAHVDCWGHQGTHWVSERVSEVGWTGSRDRFLLWLSSSELIVFISVPGTHVLSDIVFLAEELLEG